MTPGPATRAGADLTEFGVRVLLKDAQIGATSNGSISPYSIYAALAMTDAGARGTTQAQLDKLLGGDQQRQAGNITAIDAAVAKAVAASKSGRGKPTVVRAANSLWPDKSLPVRHAYLEQLSSGYGAQLHVVDYKNDPAGATEQINDWVSERTNKLIPHLLGPGSVTAATRLELVNALYLKAAWQEAFGDPGKPSAFTTAAGTQVQVPYMEVETQMVTAHGTGWESVTIPYQGGGMAMTVVLPAKGTFAQIRSSLAHVLTTATSAKRARAVDLSMPAFSIDTSSQLAPTLQSLGVTQLFGSADLSGIAGKPGEIQVNSVVHQSVVKVDQHGTEAAAATAVGIQAGAVPQQLPERIMVDRAFFFVIHDTTTGAPLFLGQIADPT
ncbi:serpin family protein [Flexivirga caeni]|nr:serpin family protein [Flexivirga caeni]